MSLIACPFPSASFSLPLAASPRRRDLESSIEDVLTITSDRHLQRRERGRHPFTRPVTLIPCDSAGQPREEGFLCMGKEISSKGFGFFHQQPLPHRYLLLSMAPTVPYPHVLLMRMKRCRFLGDCWYESAAQFVRVMPSVACAGEHPESF